MLKDTFLNQLGNYGNAVITFYNKDEIPAVMKMNVISFEDYDDEIIIRGDNGEFVILPGDPEEDLYFDEEKEFVFSLNDLKIGVVL